MEFCQNVSKPFNLRGLPKTIANPAPETMLLPNLDPRPWQDPLPNRPATASGRCSERGCVFPAAGTATGRCRQHERQAREPILFSSHQPTRVVLESGRFDVPEADGESLRSRDRRRMAALREAFLEG